MPTVTVKPGMHGVDPVEAIRMLVGFLTEVTIVGTGHKIRGDPGVELIRIW